MKHDSQSISQGHLSCPCPLPLWIGWTVWNVIVGMLFILTACQFNASGAGSPEPVETRAPLSTATGDMLPTPETTDLQSQKALSLTEVWSFDAGEALNATPLVNGSWLYIAAKEGGIVALDTRTGQEHWRYAPSSRVWEHSMALEGDVLVVGVAGQRLVGLDAQTGQERWTTTLIGDVQYPPLVADGMLYVGTTFVGTDLASKPEQKAWLYAVHVSTGQVAWSLETDNYLVVTPSLFQTTLFAGGSYFDPDSDIEEGGPMRMYALDAPSGKVRWISESDAGLIKRLHASADLVYYLAYQDTLFALDADTGKQVWNYSTENWTPDFIVAPDGIFFGVGNGVVHAIDPVTGKLLWKFHMEGIFGAPLGAPQRLGNIVYVQTAQRYIYALEASTGDLVWQTWHDIPTRVEPAIDDDHVYVAGRDGKLRAFAMPRVDTSKFAPTMSPP